MIYIIILLSIALIVLFIIAISRGKTYDIFAEISRGELDSNAKNLAIAMRMPDAVGASPKTTNIKRLLKSAYKIISHKVDNNEDIYEYEKWLYENYFLIVNSFSSQNYRSFALLPHKDKRVRVLIVANFLSHATKGHITSENIEQVINVFNSHTPLHTEEIFALKNAIIFSLTDKIATICSQVRQMDKMKRAAVNNKYINDKFTSSDCYLYWLRRSGKELKMNSISNSADINIDNIEYSFSTVLIDNAIIMSNCVSSIKAMKDIFTSQELLHISYSNKLLMADKIYCSMDNDSKLEYLMAIERLSTIFNRPEKQVIDAAFALAREHNAHFGRYLFEQNILLRAYLFNKKTKRIKVKTSHGIERLMASMIFALTIIGGTALGLFGYNIATLTCLIVFGIFALLPTAEYLLQRAHKFILPTRPIAKMSYHKLPDDHSVMVVVPYYIAQKEDIQLAIDNIKSLREGNKGENITFALLLDYPRAQEVTVSDDYKWNAHIDSELAGYDDINCYTRRRKKIGNSYSAFERKRGAINALNEMLLTHDEGEFAHITHKNWRKPEYIIVIDADSKLLPGTVLSAVNTIAHPLNEQYDLMAFGNKYNMYSFNSIFSRQFYYDSGFEGYNKYSEYYYNVSQKSIFCGKGIYRLASYYDKLKDVLPDGKILSHDIIEGSIVNTGLLNDTVFEDAPSTMMAEQSRRNRWLVGDIQLSTMVGNRIKNSHGKVHRVKKSPQYNYVMMSNMLKGLAPIALLALLMLGLFSMNIIACIPFIMAYGLRPLMQMLEIVGGFKSSIRARYLIKQLITVVVDTIISAIMLPIIAVNNVIIFIKTIFTMIFLRAKELKWKTFAQSQGDSSFKSYIIMLIPSYIVMTIIACFAAHNLAVLGYCAIFVAVSFACYVFNVPRDKKYPITTTECHELMRFARKTYSFFDANRSESGLICDNLQVNPYKGAATNSSPTNFGMSLLAEVSASELDIIDSDAAIKNIGAILRGLTSLKKYKGHLYNWYNIESKQILAPYFISSVDSANLVACLIVTKQYLLKHNSTDSEICEALISAHDFEFLLDKNKQLYYIGYDTRTKEYAQHYDLLASEARILNYIVAALYSSSTVWMRLNRDVIKLYGNTLLSWSGTMFEYLMPALFMRGSEMSMLECTNYNAVKAQKNNKCNNLFGTSESGYYKFDDNLNYQYYAFGDNRLALRTSSNRCIIAPYASALALAYDPAAAIKNMRELTRVGMLGEYGFYEAIDYTSGKHIVKSYMAHHQGMTIAAICNCINNNILVKYFMSDNRMQSAKLLLNERKNIKIAKGKKRTDYKYNSDNKCSEFVVKCSPEIKPTVAMLSNGNYHCMIDDCGNGYSSSGDIMITRYRKNCAISQGIMGYFQDRDTGERFSCSLSPMKDYSRHDKVQYTAEFTPAKATFVNTDKAASCEIFVPHCIKGEVRHYKIANDSDGNKSYFYNLYMEEIISRYNDDVAHQTFNDMFIETSYDADNQTVIAMRKSREREGDRYIAIVCLGGSVNRVTTNKYNALGRHGDLRDIKYLPQSDSGMEDFGAVLYPCCAMEIGVNVDPGTSGEFTIIVAYASSRGELDNIISEINAPDFVSYARSSASVKSLSITGKYIKSQREYELATILASRVLCGAYSNDVLKVISSIDIMAEYSKIGLDGSNKTIVYRHGANEDDLAAIARIVSYINACGIGLNLVILYSETDRYHKAMYNKIIAKLVQSTLRIKLIENTIDAELIISTAFIDINSLIMTKPIDSLLLDFTRNSDKILSESDVFYPMIKLPNIALNSGFGGFDASGDYIVTSSPLMPYSNVVADINGGFIANENGGGYTFFGNSRENKVSIWQNNPIIDTPSEGLYITSSKMNGGLIRINNLGRNGYVKHGRGYTEYYNCALDIDIVVKENMINDGRIKVHEITFTNMSSTLQECELIFMLSPSLGWCDDNQYLLIEQLSASLIKFTNALSREYCYISTSADCVNISGEDYSASRVHADAVGSLFDSPLLGNIVGCRVKLSICAGAKIKQFIMLSRNNEQLANIMASDIYKQNETSIAKFNCLNPIKLITDNKSLDLLFNHYLMYQVVSARLNGKTGYYQCSGAIGFRDQLQDCLAYLYSDSGYVRDHIIDSAAHQFIEGDVLHWWHKPALGVRTRISDDKLFLPFVVSQYIKHTGDNEILDEIIPYIDGIVLAEGQESRYSDYKISSNTASLLQHCKLAIDSALVYGEDNLLLIGSGDWNDALNDIGIHGKGQSVWLTMFAYQVIAEFIDYLTPSERLGYLKAMDRMYTAINNQYCGGWYRRARTDDGVWLGDDKAPCCKIDLISQAFAVISNCGKVKDIRNAMQSAEEMLVDRDKGIIKLLHPPFNKSFYCGYISSYPEGVRENGGQYTHAATWYIKARAMMGDYDEAMGLIDMINPIVKCADEKINKIYMTEPYVLTGDVYSSGQGGWSWYSGSAAWMYKVIIENIMGLNFRGNYLYIDPHYIKSIGKDYRIELTRGNVLYKMHFMQTNQRTLSIDGVFINKCNNRTQMLQLPLYSAKDIYNVEITF